MKSSPPSEVEVLKNLLKANVRGLPQPHFLESALVKDNGNVVETRSFPEKCDVALTASNTEQMEKLKASYASGHTSKRLAPGANVREPLLHRAKDERIEFNKPLKIRRQLTRVLM